jgi:cobalt-zinc-cadmium efflux system outer membrane protein
VQQNVRGTEVSQEALQNQIAARVLTSYWTVLGSQQIEAALAESVDNLGRTVQYHRDRVREGSLPEGDLIRIQLEYEQVVINHQNAKQDSRRQLSLPFREMGVPERPDVKLSGDLAGVPQLNVSNLEEAVARRPDVRIARQGVEQVQAALRLQRANAVPDPEFLAGYKRTGGFDTVIVGVQINLPFRNRNQGSIAAAAGGKCRGGFSSRRADFGPN